MPFLPGELVEERSKVSRFRVELLVEGGGGSLVMYPVVRQELTNALGWVRLETSTLSLGIETLSKSA